MLVAVLACVIAFSGRLQSADEIAVYALTQSFGQRGAFDINILASTAPGMITPPFTGVGQFGSDANFYSGKGVLPSLLALPLFKASLLIGVDAVVASLVTSMMLTALTAWMIARFVRLELGSQRAAFLCGALYVVGTMALAYSKRMFTEPAAALCVTLSFIWLASTTQSDGNARHVAAGLAFGGAIAASYSNAVLLPCFVALIVIRRRGNFGQRSVLFLAGIAPWLVGLAIYNFLRFGSPTDTGLSLFEWSVPYFSPQAALVRMYGLWFSPYRSFILYNLILLLLPLAWITARINRRNLWNERNARFLLALVTAISGTVAYLIFFSFWSMWWGGFNWGPRFLLPILPLWLIALAPAFELMFDRATRAFDNVLRAAMWTVVALSVLVSTIGGLADTFRSEGEWAQSGALGALVKPEALNASPLLTGFNAFQAVTGANQIVRGELDTWWATPLARDDELARAMNDVAERATPDSAVLLIAPAGVQSFLHIYRLSNPIVGLSPDQIRPGDDAPAQRVLDSANRILLITDVAQTDSGNTTERWLEMHAFRSRNEFYGAWRVAAFGTPVAQSALITPTARFGEALMLSSLQVSPVVSPGGAVTIAATWQRTSDTADANRPIAWFAHLLAPDGSLVGQHDALLGGGYSWDSASSTLVDRRGVLVPTDAQPGAYRVRIGAYTSDVARLPVTQNGARLPDDVVTFDVVVQ